MLDRELHIKEFTEQIEKNQGIIFKVSGMYCDNEDCRKDLFQDTFQKEQLLVQHQISARIGGLLHI